MSQSYIAKRLRRLVSEQSKHRCGYCLTQEVIIGMPLTIDHLVPEALGGKTEESNLWLCCRRCNERKSDRLTAQDPVTGDVVPLFNPRRQQWHHHFEWGEGGVEIVGLTPSGRATVAALQLNNSYIVKARRRWIAVGWHPPDD